MYRESDINEIIGDKERSETEVLPVAVYCRVSSNDQKQKGDLERQKGRVLDYCVKQGYKVKLIPSNQAYLGRTRKHSWSHWNELRRELSPSSRHNYYTSVNSAPVVRRPRSESSDNALRRKPAGHFG